MVIWSKQNPPHLFQNCNYEVSSEPSTKEETTSKKTTAGSAGKICFGFALQWPTPAPHNGVNPYPMPRRSVVCQLHYEGEVFFNLYPRQKRGDAGRKMTLGETPQKIRTLEDLTKLPSSNKAKTRKPKMVLSGGEPPLACLVHYFCVSLK